MMLLKVWVAYAIWGVLVYSAAFVWAVRTRQFTELDRQRRMALDPDESVDDSEGIDVKPCRADKYTWLGLFLLTFTMVGVIIVIGLRNG